MSTAMQTKAEVIAAKVFDPSQPSIFVKHKKSDRANYSEIHCSCDSCPLRAVRQCAVLGVLGGYCPYGRMRTESGPTQRAANWRRTSSSGFVSIASQQSRMAAGSTSPPRNSPSWVSMSICRTRMPACARR
jgi:hypothetical protein